MCSPCCPRDSQESSPAPVWKHQFFVLAFFIAQLSHPYMTNGKIIALAIWTFVDKVMSVLSNTQSSLVIAIIPRSKCLLISWIQSQFTLILESKKGNLTLFSHFPYLFAKKWWDWLPWSSFFECWGFFFFNLQMNTHLFIPWAF